MYWLQVDAVHFRPVRGPQDFWKVRDLLVRTASSAPVGLNWDVRRWDGAYFYNPRFQGF